MQMLIDWGAMFAQDFYATTYRNENPRMRALFDRFGFVAKADPDDPKVVIYTASVANLVRAGERATALRQRAAFEKSSSAPALAHAQPWRAPVPGWLMSPLSRDRFAVDG